MCVVSEVLVLICTMKCKVVMDLAAIMNRQVHKKCFGLSLGHDTTLVPAWNAELASMQPASKLDQFFYVCTTIGQDRPLLS
jgi:hypothetical protein